MTNEEPRKPRILICTEELWSITDEDVIAAAILNKLLYWTEHSKFDNYLVAEEMMRDINPNFLPEKGWIYKSAKELAHELMSPSRQTIQRKLNYLVEKGLLFRRSNPNRKNDNTYQYRVNITQIQIELAKLGFVLPGQTFPQLAILMAQNPAHSEQGVAHSEQGVAHSEQTIPRKTHIRHKEELSSLADDDPSFLSVKEKYKTHFNKIPHAKAIREIKYILENGVPAKRIIKAIEIAAEKDILTWGYVKGILGNWTPNDDKRLQNGNNPLGKPEDRAETALSLFQQFKTLRPEQPELKLNSLFYGSLKVVGEHFKTVCQGQGLNGTMTDQQFKDAWLKAETIAEAMHDELV